MRKARANKAQRIRDFLPLLNSVKDKTYDNNALLAPYALMKSPLRARVAQICHRVFRDYEVHNVAFTGGVVNISLSFFSFLSSTQDIRFSAQNISCSD